MTEGRLTSLNRPLLEDASPGAWDNALLYWRYPTFSLAWQRRRLTALSPLLVLVGAAFGAWHGASMHQTAEGFGLALHAITACLISTAAGPFVAGLIRHRRLAFKVERILVPLAILAGLALGLLAFVWTLKFHERLMARHMGMIMGAPEIQSVARLIGIFLNEGPRWVIFIFAGGGFALFSYFGEHRRLAEQESRRAIAGLQSQKDAADARLAVLQAQVEPHFLFNTLASVRSLVRSDPERAAKTVDALADYLRTTLPKLRAETGAAASTLGEQIDRCASYLAVMNVRMDGRIEVVVEASEALRALAFPPLILITLVENAVRHGLEPKAGQGMIAVRARLKDAALEVAVEDDGAGLSPGIGGGVGLANVRSQLHNRFGDAASLEIAARAGGGVRAVIRVPAAAA